MPVDVEFVGGPVDGLESTLSDEQMDLIAGSGRVPERFEARPGVFGEAAGVYRVTRSLTVRGRLIYRFHAGE